MTAPLIDKPTLDATRDKIVELANTTHANVLKAAQDFSVLIRSGQPAAADRDKARQAAMDGVTGLERVRVATHFDNMWPDADAYKAARKEYLNPSALAASLTPGGKPSGPIPAIVVLSSKPKVEALVAAAGLPFAMKLAETIDTVTRNDGAGEPMEFEFFHAGRSTTVFVHGVRPQTDVGIAAALMLRVAAISAESPEANASFLRTTKTAVRSALKEWSVYSADRAIRDLGAVDGFSTKAAFGNGAPAAAR